MTPKILFGRQKNTGKIKVRVLNVRQSVETAELCGNWAKVKKMEIFCGEECFFS